MGLQSPEVGEWREGEWDPKAVGEIMWLYGAVDVSLEC